MAIPLSEPVAPPESGGATDLEFSAAAAGTVVIVPAYRPTEALPPLVNDLLDRGFGRVVVIDDGSGPEFRPLFDEVATLARVTVLRHYVNLGKGAAMKTGFNHAAVIVGDEVERLVTVDADGQHLAADVQRVVEQAAEAGDALVVGARGFGGEVPLRSRFGNIVTRWVFRFFVGVRLSDTQSGLRAMPLTHVGWLLRIPSNRYEYELDMLVHAAGHSLPIHEVPIQTVYLDDNASSHFRPLLDSIRIYFVFARYIAASVATAVLDNLVFTLVWYLGGSVLVSMIAARTAAGAFQYEACRRTVFRSRAGVARSLPRFALLVAATGAISYGAIEAWRWTLGGHVLVVKIVVEFLLFLLTFLVQRAVVFSSRVPR